MSHESGVGGRHAGRIRRSALRSYTRSIVSSRRANPWVLGVLAAAFLVTILAAIATCSRTDEPPPHAPVVQEPSRTDAATSAGRRTRHRLRAEVVSAPEPPQVNQTPAPDPDWDVETTFDQPMQPPPTPPTGTGRVKILMLKDGHPFEGAHVCFYPADQYVDAKPWDGARWSDSASFPLYVHFWPFYEPVLGSADGAQNAEERSRGITDVSGSLVLDVRAGVTLVPYVRYQMSGIPLVAQPRVKVAEGGETTLRIEAAAKRSISGRCTDEAGRGLVGIWVQAIAPGEERPLSLKRETTADGSFLLDVWGSDPQVSVRALVPHAARPLGIYEAESDIPPIPAETTVAGVVPGDRPVSVRMAPTPVVIIELTSNVGEAPSDLQVESLVYDPRASAWGRLGGPKYARVAGPSPHPVRGFVALPVPDAARPLMLWSRGLTLTAVDTRGADRLAVTIPRGRQVTLRGRGWRETDRLRVVAWVGPPGEEFPCIWIERQVGKEDRWGAPDAPIGAIEFQLVRDGEVIGRSRIAAGDGPASEASIDID